MKKSYFILIILIFFIFNSFSQSTFNVKEKIMHHINHGGPVLTINDTIICIGHGVDHDPYDYYAIFTAKFDVNGNFINRSIYRERAGTLFFFDHTHSAFLSENRIVTVVDVNKSTYTYDSIYDPFNGGYLLIIDIISGEIEKIIKFSNPYNFTDFHAVDDITQIDSVTFAVVSTLDEKGQNILLDLQISIINIKTEEVKYIQFGRKAYTDSPMCIEWNGDKLIVGAYTSLPDPLNPVQMRIFNTLIYSVDTSGTVEEVYFSKPNRTGAWEILIDEDGNYVFVSSINTYYKKIPGLELYFSKNQIILSKLDKNFNLIWEKPCGLPFELTNFGNGSNVLTALDGDGYIVALSQPNYQWNITEAGKDSMKMSGISPMGVGVLNKISKDGESIWLRSYSVVNDINDNYQFHTIRDMTYSNDGGYIVFGDVSYSQKEGDSIWNHPSWLFKVDSYGCLIPGCQNEDTLGTKQNDYVNDLLIYPNPATDKLYVFQDEHINTRYVISDLNGRIITSWAGNIPDHTFIVDLCNYRPGVYIISSETKGGKIKSRKFIVD